MSTEFICDEQKKELLDRFQGQDKYYHFIAASVPGQCAVTIGWNGDTEIDDETEDSGPLLVVAI